jgi:DNA-binding CsgD family transcriptional regulator
MIPENVGGMHMKGQMKDILQELVKQEDPYRKMEIAMKRFLDLYPFDRASIFTYTPLTYIGEGVLMVDPNGVSSLQRIREDVRGIVPLFSALQERRARYLTDEYCKKWFPVRYVNEFELTSLVVVPIQHETTIIGCIMADRRNGMFSISDEMLHSMQSFGRMVGESIVNPSQFKGRSGLSNREREVLQRMAEGQSIKQMADEMGISEFTARDYVSSAMKKLGVLNRTQAVAKAIRLGMI